MLVLIHNCILDLNALNNYRLTEYSTVTDQCMCKPVYNCMCIGYLG